MHTVLLVNPGMGPSLSQFARRPKLPNNILLVGTALHHAGYKVKLIDQAMEEEWKHTLLKVLQEDVICIGISSTTGNQISYGLEIAKFIRTHSDRPIVWGGIHPTLLPEQTLENEFVDIVVRGEGEETIVELTNALQDDKSLNGISGVSYKENGRIVHNPDRAFLDLKEQPGSSTLNRGQVHH